MVVEVIVNATFIVILVLNLHNKLIFKMKLMNPKKSLAIL